jgi:hypothetical protein
MASEEYPDRKIVQFHNGRPEEESRQWCLERWTRDIEKMNWHSENLGIADRWHWGEITYAPLKRPHTCKDEYGLLGVAGWRFIELTLLSRGVTQFVVKQPIETLIDRVSKRGDDFVNIDELTRISELYDFGIANSARVEILTPDADSVEEIPTLCKRILSISKTRHQETENLSQFKEYIGAPRPKALLVGDRRNNQFDTPVLPFYPINGNSGDYLLSCLPAPFWKSVGVVNGTESCGPRLKLLWEVLKKPRIVALGRMADKAIRTSGIPIEMINTVPHPQYVRRFHHHDRYEYGLAIQRLSREKAQEDRWILR